jgi:hypothetical protein
MKENRIPIVNPTIPAYIRFIHFLLYRVLWNIFYLLIEVRKMTIKDIIDYVMHTPENTNPNILKDMFS